MWRFPTFFAGMIALSLPSTGAFGNDAAPRHASPPSAPSVPTQGASNSDASAHQAERNSAAYLQRQVSDLQDLAASVKQQLGQREARGSGPDAGGRQATVNFPEQEDADLQRQDNELHTELQGLIAQLEQELRLETKNPPAPAAEEQQQRQAALHALKYLIADLQQDDSKLQDLIAQHHQRIYRARRKRRRHRIFAGGRRQVTRLNTRLPLCSVRLPICADRATRFGVSSPSKSRSFRKAPRSWLNKHATSMLREPKRSGWVRTSTGSAASITRRTRCRWGDRRCRHSS